MESNFKDLRDATEPSLIEHFWALATLCLIIEQQSRLPEVGVLPAFFATASFLCLGALYVVRGMKWGRCDASPWAVVSGGAILNWSVLPICLVLIMTGAATHWPARVRFRLSQESLEEAVELVRRGDEPTRGSVFGSGHVASQGRSDCTACRQGRGLRAVHENGWQRLPLERVDST